jgi:23S rRNA (adenine2030-N6)-methyltransferase
VVVLNAPWNLDDTLREPLRTLATLLGPEAPARWTLDWLRQEGAEPPEPSPLPPSRLAHLRATQSAPGPHTRRRRDSR